MVVHKWRHCQQFFYKYTFLCIVLMKFCHDFEKLRHVLLCWICVQCQVEIILIRQLFLSKHRVNPIKQSITEKNDASVINLRRNYVTNVITYRHNFQVRFKGLAPESYAVTNLHFRTNKRPQMMLWRWSKWNLFERFSLFLLSLLFNRMFLNCISRNEDCKNIKSFFIHSCRNSRTLQSN